MKLDGYPGHHHGAADLVENAGAPVRSHWWLNEALRWEAAGSWSPPLRSHFGSSRADVVIVGGGYTGLWAAHALLTREPSLQVVVVEQHQCGYGASGRNGGLASGYWRYLPALVGRFGDQGARDIALAGAAAQQGIADLAAETNLDFWWQDTGHLKVTTVPDQVPALDAVADQAARLGHAEQATRLDADAVATLCNSERFGEGLLFAEGGVVQPARLARVLRQRVVGLGAEVLEHTTVTDVRDLPQGELEVITERGRIRCSEVVLASNAALSRNRLVRRHVTPFSSHIALTQPVPEILEEAGWTSGAGIFDSMMFLHYFRTTPDGRIAMGSGSGGVGALGTLSDRLFADAGATSRARAALRRYFPGSETRVSHSWGGPIDVSADKLPFFGTDPIRRVHYAAGYSGHGVNPAWIGGQTLASLVLAAPDAWTDLPFASRRIPGFPPEPARTWGAHAISSAIIRTEQAAADARRPRRIDLAIGAVPRLLGMPLGTR